MHNPQYKGIYKDENSVITVAEGDMPTLDIMDSTPSTSMLRLENFAANSLAKRECKVQSSVDEIARRSVYCPLGSCCLTKLFESGRRIMVEMVVWSCAIFELNVELFPVEQFSSVMIWFHLRHTLFHNVTRSNSGTHWNIRNGEDWNNCTTGPPI